MVKLSFRTVVPGKVDQVFQYFANFANIAEWDPGCKSSKLCASSSGSEGVAEGTRFDLVTVFKGRESKMTYEVKTYEEPHKVVLEGFTSVVHALDEIRFSQDESDPDRTRVEYDADIRLRGVFKLFTPFIRRSIMELAPAAQQGFESKAGELFGKEEEAQEGHSTM
ncbi:Polyketide cyclase [Balamuthia mandrillaris]